MKYMWNKMKYVWNIMKYNEIYVKYRETNDIHPVPTVDPAIPKGDMGYALRFLTFCRWEAINPSSEWSFRLSTPRTTKGIFKVSMTIMWTISIQDSLHILHILQMMLKHVKTATWYPPNSVFSPSGKLDEPTRLLGLTKGLRQKKRNLFISHWLSHW
jgi:hypothetical protein